MGQIPATIALLIINCAVFALTYWRIGTFSEPVWTLGLLRYGAEFNPYTLDGEWHRIFTHMFLHAHPLHLALNLYALFISGSAVESKAGTVNFLIIYLLSGVASALSSLYWNLFTIGVGASGAIFGLFGYSLVTDLFQTKKLGRSMVPQLVNFVIFLAVNLLFAQTMHADNSAHMGGLCCGIVLGLCASIDIPIMKVVWPKAIVAMLLFTSYLFLPRYQVTYFKFFQQILQTEDSIRAVMGNNSVSDEVFLSSYKKALRGWDSALVMLDRHRYLPEALHSDTLILRRYIDLQKKEGVFRTRMIGNQSYIYMDSIQWAVEQRKKSPNVHYRLVMRYQPPDTARNQVPEQTLEPARIWYDSDWIEIPLPPAAFTRLGYRDSLKRWQGPLTDYFESGRVQMKGRYKDDLKDGIFIYYRANGKYEAAGIYKDEMRVGKWETFHPNGKIESEIFYNDRYFLKSYWDSLGVQMIKDGYGTEIHRYDNGIVGAEGKYVDGYKDGYWYGRHRDGRMYFEENYRQGRLINGRSTSINGDVVVYDETALYALPKGGYPNLYAHIRKRTAAVSDSLKGSGTVRLTFRVTVNQKVADMRVRKGISKHLDDLAKKIILDGPAWLPARVHGQELVDGFGWVDVEF